MWNAGLDEAQAGIKTVGKNINNLRYADDTTLMGESEEELNCIMYMISLLSLSNREMILHSKVLNRY